MTFIGGGATLDLPPRLKGLEFLATDLRFTWSYTADHLWQKLDPDLFALTRTPYFHNWLKLKLESGEIVPSPAVQVVPGGLPAIHNALNDLKKGVSGIKYVVEV